MMESNTSAYIEVSSPEDNGDEDSIIACTEIKRRANRTNDVTATALGKSSAQPSPYSVTQFATLGSHALSLFRPVTLQELNEVIGQIHQTSSARSSSTTTTLPIPSLPLDVRKQEKDSIPGRRESKRQKHDTSSNLKAHARSCESKEGEEINICDKLNIESNDNISFSMRRSAFSAAQSFPSLTSLKHGHTDDDRKRKAEYIADTTRNGFIDFALPLEENLTSSYQNPHITPATGRTLESSYVLTPKFHFDPDEYELSKYDTNYNAESLNNPYLTPVLQSRK